MSRIYNAAGERIRVSDDSLPNPALDGSPAGVARWSQLSLDEQLAWIKQAAADASPGTFDSWMIRARIALAADGAIEELYCYNCYRG